MLSLPTSTILSHDRQRQDLQDLPALVDSIRRLGQLQPILITRDNVLVAGGRRLEACRILGIEVKAEYTDSQSPATNLEMEYEENTARADFTWQERVLAISRIHRAHQLEAGREGSSWSNDATAALLNVAKSQVWYATTVAERLLAGDAEITAASGITEALQLLTSRKEKELETAILAASTSHSVVPGGPSSTITLSSQEVPVPLGTTPPPNITIHLANALDWLRSQPEGSLDHIYSDPPYAIDMDTLQQPGSGMDISTVRDTHVVEDNLNLLDAFIGLAASRLRPTGFMVLWIDLVHLERLSLLGSSAGLRVCRWPLHWVKTHTCMNQSANSNFTKAVEHAILMAGPKAVLAKTRPTNFWTGPSDKSEHNITNPFWKPLALHTWILEGIALPGSTIVDPFAGCGSIPLAATRGGWPAIAVELDPTHYLSMLERFKLS
jgi:hypothetical protein